MEEIRFYIKNIPPDVCEEDVRKHFHKIGDIYNVTLKQNYGFFSLKSQPEKIPKIVKMYNNKQWNNYLITLEKSEKESFMDRLARERQAENRVTKSNETTLFDKENGKKGKRKSESYSNDEDNYSKIKAGVPMFTGTKPKNSTASHLDSTTNGEKDVMSSFSEFDSMWADEERDNLNNHNVSQYLHSKEKTKTNSRTIEKGVPITKSEKKVRDDERRRQSLANKAKEKLKQQNVIQSALSSSNTTKSKKIIFDSEDEEQNDKLKLFDESLGDNENVILPFKEHFEGEGGKKLLDLQSQFNNDERFKLDKRFLDDGESSDVKKRKEEKKFEMLRYDPTKSDYDSSDPKTSKVRSELNTTVAPIVSKEKFYEVSAEMKISLQQKGSGFSLLATYGRKEVDLKPEEHLGQNEPQKILKRNPMFMDSSDEEADTDVTPKIWAPTINIPLGARDNFFFAENDPLIKEAFEFMNMKNSEEAAKAYENYFETRNVLRKIFKGQVLKRSKKTDMFKKKVGGMKKKIGNFNTKPWHSQKGKR